MIASRTRSSTARSFLPAKSRWPVSSSNSTMPAANTSARWSIAVPLTCSGAMYPNFPFRIPVAVFSLVVAFAMPKSPILTSPSNDRSTFEGETSRWMMPSGAPSVAVRRWACSSPRRTSITMYKAMSVGKPIRFRPQAARVFRRSRPSTYSIAM